MKSLESLNEYKFEEFSKTWVNSSIKGPSIKVKKISNFIRSISFKYKIF